MKKTPFFFNEKNTIFFHEKNTIFFHEKNTFFFLKNLKILKNPQTSLIH